MRQFVMPLVLLALLSNCLAATNYDEQKVGDYTLPDPLTLLNGQPVTSAATWREQRRPEIVKLFEKNQFGRCPDTPLPLKYETWDVDPMAINGKAIRKQVTVYFGDDKKAPAMDMLIYLPVSAASTPAPLFLCLSFTGNHQAYNDPKVRLKPQWDRKTNLQVMPLEASRKTSWPVEEAIARGYGMAFICYTDIEPDFEGGMKLGVRPLYFKPGQTEPAVDEWGSVAAWGWGLSRGMDVLEGDKQVDAGRVALVGHSRLGKTVLWAGARDTRFAAVIASCSGEGGATLSRRDYGETIADLTTRFPWQFCANYRNFAGHADRSPVDGNMVVALIAPRPLLLNTGSEDRWSDPRGEFLSAVAAGKVYELLGRQPLGTSVMPPLDESILHDLGYHCHTGKHEIAAGDWPVFFQFADLHLKR